MPLNETRVALGSGHSITSPVYLEMCSSTGWQTTCRVLIALGLHSAQLDDSTCQKGANLVLSLQQIEGQASKRKP